MKQILKAIVGSQAYGTATPESDIDHKGIYVQPIQEIVSYNRYKQQYEVGKDECYYEVARFLHLLGTANPTMIELLYIPEDCIVALTPEFRLIQRYRKMFLTKACRNSFGGYVVTQIQKAKGLQKKVNWEANKTERKTILDFCYIPTLNGSRPLKDWLRYQKGIFTDQKNYGAAKVPNCRDLYTIYPKVKSDLEYYGLTNDEETSNELRLASIPSEETIRGVNMSFNKDGYILHCKDYLSYQTWLQNRNTQRYVDIKGHNQSIDGKNLLHCRRLLDVSLEIACTGDFTVRRSNASDLLAIRRGEVNLEDIIKKAEEDLVKLDELYSKCDLPDSVDEEKVNELLLKIRYYEQK